MKVAFTSASKISLNAAKLAVIEQFPDLASDILSVANKTDLETLLSVRGFVVYVDDGLSAEMSAILANEAVLSAAVDAALDECHVAGLAQVFTQLEIDEELCFDLPEQPEIPNVDAADIARAEAAMAELISESDGGLSAGKTLADLDPNSKIGKIVGCINEMQAITNDINELLSTESKIKTTLVNFEQLLYHYRTMEPYYRTKVDTLDGLVDQFTVLIREKRQLESSSFNTQLVQKQAALDQYNVNLDPNVQTPTPVQLQMQAEIDQILSQNSVQAQRLVEITESIRLAKAGTWSFDMAALQSGELADRRSELLSQLQSIGQPNAFNGLGEFSSNVSMEIVNSGAGEGQNFRLEILHETIDDAHILSGMDLSFTKTGGTVRIENYALTDPTGVLYDNLYNVWGDPDLFFTRFERGLTADGNQMDPTLMNTGAGAVRGSYIQNMSKYEEFYSNYSTYHSAKVMDVKNTVIEPTLARLQDEMSALGRKEVQLLLSFGRVYEVLPEDIDPEGEGARLKTLMQSVRDSGSKYLEKINACRTVYEYIVKKHDGILSEIEGKKKEYSNVKCAVGGQQSEPKKAPGSDPLGLNMGSEDPNDPNFTKMCYWLKFAAFATAVNLLPISGESGLRYWPVGLVVPTPTKVVKVPLPIIWTPLAVISLPVGVFVIFIGLCGICPSPFVMYCGTNGEKKFIISLRPTQSFGTDASAGTIKAVDKGGVVVNVNKFKLDSAEIANKIPEFKLESIHNNVLTDIKENIIRKINKIGSPDMSRIARLTKDSSGHDRRMAFTQSAESWLDRLSMTDTIIPKDASVLNPKPTPVATVLSQLKKAISLELPQISVPTSDLVNIKLLFIREIVALKAPAQMPPDIIVPIEANNSQVQEFIQRIKNVLSSISGMAIEQITPEALGMVAVASGGVSFSNPYVCRQVGGGIIVPGNPTVTAALLSLRVSAQAIVDGLEYGAALQMLDRPIPGTVVNWEFIKRTFSKLLEKNIPAVSIPNPSNLSIKDMLLSAGNISASIQLPSLPDLSVPLQRPVTIPGAAVKNAIKEGVMSAIKYLPPDNFTDLHSMSSVDFKQVVISLVEDSFGSLDGTVRPFLNMTNKFKQSKDRSFGELLGLSKVDKDDTKVPVVSDKALEKAKGVLSALSVVPYPAVSVSPSTFKKLHPILVQDDLPPWDRLSLSNFLFVAFLDEWCVQGKKGGGFFENP